MVFRLEFHRIMEEVVPGIHLLKTAATGWSNRRSADVREVEQLLYRASPVSSSSTSSAAAGEHRQLSEQLVGARQRGRVQAELAVEGDRPQGHERRLLVAAPPRQGDRAGSAPREQFTWPAPPHNHSASDGTRSAATTRTSAANQ